MCVVQFFPSRAADDLHRICDELTLSCSSYLSRFFCVNLQLLALSNIELIALMPRWIHKLMLATSEQLPVYKKDIPPINSWFVTAQTVKEMFNMQTVAAVAAQAVTPNFHPVNW
jgi:hypothetical protein